MKITKTRLKEIIKEELEKTTLSVNEVDLSQVFQQRQAQKATKAPGKEPTPDANPNATKIQDVAKMLQYIDKINTPQEYSNLLDKVIGHAQNVRGSTIILRKLQKALPSLMEEDLDETSAMGTGPVAGHSGASKKEEKKKKKGFPDLTGDGKVTKADVLKGRGVELKEDGWDDPHV